MFIVAGLPKATHRRAIARLRERFPEAEIIGSASTSDDGQLYRKQLCSNLATAVTSFAVRKRLKSPAEPAVPRLILLLYVPSDDDDLLLRTFDFAVFSEPLVALQARDLRGFQLRHSQEAVDAALETALARDGRALDTIARISQRLGRLTDDEFILLPPYNFITANGRLSSVFRALRNRELAWTDRGQDLGLVELTSRDTPRIPAGKTRRVFVDVRKVAYLMAHPLAFHGVARELEEGAELDSRTSVLRSLYRFGAMLNSGLHHDAQLSDGSDFEAFEFDCSTEGRVAVSGTHANVYPNDFIRAAGKVKI